MQPDDTDSNIINAQLDWIYLSIVSAIEVFLYVMDCRAVLLTYRHSCYLDKPCIVLTSVKFEDMCELFLHTFANYTSY